MGIRPSFYILVGIDDAIQNDPRLKPLSRKKLNEIIYERQLTKAECFSSSNGIINDYHEWELKIPGASISLAEKIYNPFLSDEYFVPNVTGYIIERSHDDHFLRALATLDDRYFKRGYSLIPLLDASEHYYLSEKYTQDDIDNNMLVASFFENMPSISRIQWGRAQHYLGLIGWTLSKRELRYMLVWDWQ